MSFSTDIKRELVRAEEPKKCCMLAEIAGFLRLSGTIGLEGGGRYYLKLTTEDPDIARLFVKRMKDYFGADSTLSVGENIPLKKGNLYELTIGSGEGTEMILRETGILVVRQGSNFFSEEVQEHLVKKKCDKRAFLKGVFLGGGTISDPKSGYHLELVCGSPELADDVRRIIGALGLKARVTERRSRHVVYLKDAEQICDFLSFIGADSARLQLENVRILKDAKNRINRLSNFENANMDRAAENAAKQLEAIRTLQDRLGLEALPAALRQAAELRLTHPEASLTELSELAEPAVSKSGMNSRLKKLQQLAQTL